MSVTVTVRIPATLEQAQAAEQAHPGLYGQIIEIARAHGLISHRRVYREGEIMDIDEWTSEQGRAAFREEALHLIERMRSARGSGPSVAEVWQPYPHH